MSKGFVLAIAANCKPRVYNYKPYGELAVVRLGRFFSLAMFADFYSRIFSLTRFGCRDLVLVLVLGFAGSGGRLQSVV
jgi:hypothetical protein